MNTDVGARRAWTVGGGGVDHLVANCPRLRNTIAYRHVRASDDKRRVCAWCLRHPGQWDA